MKEVKTLNILDYIESNPNKFLRYEPVKGHELATNIAIDAITSGANSVAIDRVQEWWVVHSEKDWLSVVSDFPVESLFSRLIPNPNAGQNASRHEVLLTVFASKVITYLNGAKLVIKDDSFSEMAVDEYVSSQCAYSRVIAFIL